MRKLCISLSAFILLAISCKKNHADVEAPIDGLQIQINNLAGFTQINTVSATYLSETTLVPLTGLFGGDAPTSVSDGNLTINFISDFYKVDPSPLNWDGSWGTSPNVESSDPHALYNTAASPASLTLSKPVKTFGLELFWDGSIDFKVEFWNGTTLVGEVTKSFTSNGSMGQAFLFAATYAAGFNKIVFTPMGATSFGFAIAQMRYAENLVKKVHFDVLPGSCENPFNTKAQGVLPVAIAGSAGFNVNDIDLATLTVNGVPSSQYSIEKVTAPFSKTNDCDCSVPAPDNYNDLSIKFSRPAITSTLGNVSDGAQVTLTFKAKLKNGTNIEGKDCVRIKK
jgi:hypothetical protein